MSQQQALEKLSSIGQQQILSYWKELNSKEQDRLLNQIEAIHIPIFKQQQQLLQDFKPSISSDLEPFASPFLSGNRTDFAAGKQMIAQGLTGCLIVAGGQGTRLHIDGPKGTFPVTATKKSLFQVFAEKVQAAGKQALRTLPLAIMTSPLNHHQTVSFFEEHHFFGLDPRQVSFFSQGTLPLLNHDGNLFLESKGTIAEGPDGNGLALHHFFQSGIWADWNRQGVRFVNFLVVDNPLADPYDAELLGLHQRVCNDITIKCISRRHPQEKVGVLAKIKGKIAVIEYSELPQETERSSSFSFANISLFCFSMDFIKKIGGEASLLPLHKAFKSAAYLDYNGLKQQAKQPIAWKFETFIFDLIPFAQNTGALLYPREQCFSPLKNYEGEDSIDTVRQALKNNDHRVFSEITGIPCPNNLCEIPQEFYYPTPELLKQWNNTSYPR